VACSSPMGFLRLSAVKLDRKRMMFWVGSMRMQHKADDGMEQFNGISEAQCFGLGPGGFLCREVGLEWNGTVACRSVQHKAFNGP